MKQYHMYLHNVPFHHHFLTTQVFRRGYNTLRKDSVILGYDTISLGNQLWHFETSQCFQTVGNVLPNYTSYSRRPESSTTPLWRTQDSPMQIKQPTFLLKKDEEVIYIHHSPSFLIRNNIITKDGQKKTFWLLIG